MLVQIVCVGLGVILGFLALMCAFIVFQNDTIEDENEEETEEKKQCCGNCHGKDHISRL